MKTWWYLRHSSPSHWTVRVSGATTRQRSTRPECTSRFRIRQASMVLPRPTSSASSQRTGSAAVARSATWSWCGKSRMRPPRKEPRPSGLAQRQEVQDVEAVREVRAGSRSPGGEALDERAFEIERPQLVGGDGAPVREPDASRPGRCVCDRRLLAGRGNAHRPPGPEIHGQQRRRCRAPAAASFRRAGTRRRPRAPRRRRRGRAPARG